MTAGNGSVATRFRLVVQIRITDPDGVLNRWVFCGRGVAGPLISVAIGLNCPNPEIVFLRRGAHQVHPHTVVYDDCQSPVGATERWVVPPAEGEDWREGERIGTIPSAPAGPRASPERRKTTRARGSRGAGRSASKGR